MLDDTMTILMNELNDLRSHKKSLFALAFIFVSAIVFIYHKGSTSVLNPSLAIACMPAFYGGLVGLSLIFDTFQKEKKSNTLDMILVSGISEWSLLLGKVLFASMCSYVVSVILMIMIRIPFNNGATPIVSYTFLDYIIPVLYIYFFMCIIIAVNVVSNEEKFSPAISFFIAALILYAVYKLYMFISIDVVLYQFIAGIILCVATTIIAGKLLKRISYFMND